MTGRYTCVCAIICASAVALVYAEPPVEGGKPVVSQRLLNRVTDIIANGGDGSSTRDDGGQSNEGASIVDKELLDRIARIISQNDGQTSWSQKNQVASGENAAQPARSLSLPSGEDQVGYGVPPKEVPPGAQELAGAQFELSPPEPVPRIAAFDLTDEDEESYTNAKYSSPSRPQDSYADSGNLYQSSSNGRLELQEPESAARIASFDIQGEQPPAPYSPPQARGYNNNNRR